MEGADLAHPAAGLPAGTYVDVAQYRLNKLRFLEREAARMNKLAQLLSAIPTELRWYMRRKEIGFN